MRPHCLYTTLNVFQPYTTESYTYDLDGNLTADGRWTYTWDGENRLIRMEPISGVPDAAKRKLEFGYDCTGCRIQKKSYSWVSGAWSLVSDIRFAYDGWNVLAELDSSLNPIRTYLWGLDLSGSMQGAGGVGGLISVRHHGSGGAAYIALFDGNGNVAGLVSASTGTLAATYEYGPFGEPIRMQGDQISLAPFRWSTKYTDDESDLVYYGYRFYNPFTGRWPNRDPIGELGGNNLYRFVRNDCVNRIDALGLIDENSTVEEIEAEVALLIQDARNRGMNVAADMLQNYVNGGGDQVLSVGWLRSFGRVQNAEKTNQKRFEQSLEKIAAEMKCDESRTFTDYWDALISYSGRGFSTEELFWASGDSTLTSSGTFTLKRNCCLQFFRRGSVGMNCYEVIITGTVDHHWHDKYDWHAGLGVSIPGHGRIPDAAMDKLRTQGRAKIFNMTSDWQQSLVGKVVNCPSFTGYFQWTGP